MQASINKRLFIFQPAIGLSVPEDVIKAAVQANPWFTEEGIQLAFNALQGWFAPETLAEFVSRYPALQQPEGAWAGIITAGNIPFVGMHDVLMAFLAGRTVDVKCARQDAVLLPWFWHTLLQGTAYEGHVRFVESLTPPTAGNRPIILATGGDHTARQLAWKFRNQPLLMRNNRFSVAVLEPARMVAPDWHALCDDLLLYNGLGCRNVSNLIVVGESPEFTVPAALNQALGGYTSPTLSEAYRLARAYDRGRAALAPEPGLETELLRFVPATGIQPMPVGQVAVIGVASLEEANSLIHSAEDQLQVVVGHAPGMIPFGQAQQPGLADFADGVDTFAAMIGDWTSTRKLGEFAIR